jgi:hypothetical protein
MQTLQELDLRLNNIGEKGMRDLYNASKDNEVFF